MAPLQGQIRRPEVKSLEGVQRNSSWERFHTVRLFWLVLFLLTPPWLVGGLTLLALLPSGHGKLVALWLLAVLFGLWGQRIKPGPARWVLLLLAALFPALLLRYPWHTSAPSVTSVPRFPGATDRLCNVLSERDLAELGTRLFYRKAKRDRVLAILDPLYREMAQSPEYEGLPHSVGSTALDVLTNDPGPLHWTAFRPTHPRGVLIFYHGAMGNFTVYLHFWKRWAEKHDFVVICPSNGFGRWHTPEGEQRALDSLDRALESVPPEARSKVLVAGMSNGGTAVTRLINQRGDKIHGALLVCPVLEPAQVARENFLRWSQDHPEPIVIEGSEDTAVTPDMVSAGVQAIINGGGRCDYRLLEGHDHHVLFSAAADCALAADQLLEALQRRADLDHPVPGVNRK